MINRKEMIKKARTRLGAPVTAVELTDEQMENLIEDAYDSFELYANIANLSKNKYEQIKTKWIKEYFNAICKESLANIRGKFNGELSIPGSNLKVNYKGMLAESIKEKKFLRYLILQDDNVFKNSDDDVILAFYINIEDLPHSEFEDFVEKIRTRLSDDKFVKYFIPVKDSETRVECIYPIGIDITKSKVGDKIIEKINNYFFDIKNEK